MLLALGIIVAIVSVGWLGLNAFANSGSPTGESQGSYLPGFGGLCIAAVLIIIWAAT